MAAFQHRLGKIHPAVVDVGAAHENEAVARAGQRTQDGEIPEENLQQQGDVAENLHIGRGHLGRQRIGGKPRDSDDKSNDGREKNSHHGDEQGVQRADNEHPADGGGFLVIYQVKVDGESGGVVEKTKAGGLFLPRQIDGGVVGEPPDKEGQQGEGGGLIQDAAGAGAAPDVHRARRLLASTARCGSRRPGDLIPRAGAGCCASGSAGRRAVRRPSTGR